MSCLLRSILARWKFYCLGKQHHAAPSGFDELCHDILYIIAGELFLENKQYLFGMCLVSKRSYVACVPWIYRDVVVGFRDSRSHAIVQRLSTQSNIAAFVRKLTLKNGNLATDKDWAQLSENATRFTGLQVFSSRRCAGRWMEMLQRLGLPRLKIHIHEEKLLDYNADAGSPNRSILDSGIIGRTTSLELLVTKETLYDGLKHDLIAFLQQSPALVSLRIQDCDSLGELPEDRDMIPEFERGLFPKLRSLTLVTKTTLLSRMELKIWGQRSGWSRLTFLSVARLSVLAVFFWQAPRLVHLRFIAELGRGMDLLETHLKIHSDCTFPSLQHLSYSHLITNPGHSTRHILPWCILEQVRSTLTSFELHNDQDSTGHYGAVGPTAADLQKFHTMCPNLQHLALDVRMGLAGMPKDLTKALSRWEKVSSMSLTLQKPLRRPANEGLVRDFEVVLRSEAVQLMAFEDISSTRQDLVVEFAQWCEGCGMKTKPHLFAHIFCKDKSGRALHAEDCAACKETKISVSTRKFYASQSDETLKILQQNAHGANVLYWGNIREADLERHQAITTEIQRRERNARLKDIYGDDSGTLYDHITKAHMRS